MARPHRIAVIPGDGIGTGGGAGGAPRAGRGRRRFDVPIELEEFDFACADHYVTHRRDAPRRLVRAAPRLRRDLLRCGRVARGRPRPRVAVGIPAAVPAPVRPVRQPPSVPPRPGRAQPAGGRVPGDVDFLVVRENTEGEYSSIGGRIFEGTDREVVVQETVMTRVGVDRVLELRLRGREVTPCPAPHVGDEEQRHLHHDALLGRAGRRGRVALPRRAPRPVPHRHPGGQLRPQARPLRRGGGQQPVRRHPLRPRPGLHRHDRDRAERQHQPAP